VAADAMVSVLDAKFTVACQQDRPRGLSMVLCQADANTFGWPHGSLGDQIGMSPAKREFP